MEKALIECLVKVKDPRAVNGLDHKLIDILVITILAVICGADTWVEIALFGNEKIEWFKKFLELKNGIPSHDTFGRVFAAINPTEFHNAFIDWINDIREIIPGVVSIDGKTVRRTKDKENGKRAIHVVSAWANVNSLVLGQLKVDEKTNEITAIPELLKLLDVKNCIITIDAMGTQKDIAETIKDCGGDYILSLKENQKTLHDDVELYFQTEILTQEKGKLKKEEKYYKELDNSHGRIEKREYYVENQIDWLDQKEDWKGLQGIGLCVSEVTREGKTTVNYSYAIYSVANFTAENFGKAKRSHWGIENGLHWVLDIAFREDESRARKGNSAENLNIIRHMALNLLKQEKTLKVGIKAKRLRCGWNQDYLLKVLGINVLNN